MYWRLEYLVEVERLRHGADVELPRPGIADPALPFRRGVAELAPHRVRHQLQDLLRLRVAVGVAEGGRLLGGAGVPRGAVHVVRRVGEPRGVGAVHAGAVPERVPGRALVDAPRRAPRRRLRVDDHLAVPRHVRRRVAVARAAVVLPAAAHVHEVELAVGTSSLLHLQRQPHLEVW
uniref:Uncharacterized protein n=1 Tax=Oryza brachyantha TaxID=4533 RepID=J3M5F2_ORYBR